MRISAALIVALAVAGAVAAQETRPVPKDSVRVSIPGCTKGYIFTVGSRSANEAGSSYDVPEGMHLRMNGPKKMIADIRAHEGSMVQLTGLMKKDQLRPDGVNIGGGVRVGPGGEPGSMPTPGGGQVFIDVEGWRPLPDRSCPSR